jgi:hypothetical protein
MKDPAAFMSMATWMLDAAALWPPVCIFFAAIALYLTYVDWAPASNRSTLRTASSDQELPPAA